MGSLRHPTVRMLGREDDGRREWRFHDIPFDPLDPICLRVLASGDDFGQFGVVKAQSDELVGGIARLERSVADHALEGRASEWFTVVARAVAVGQEAETVDWRHAAGNRIGGALFEPADRSGAWAAENDARVPRFAQDDVDAPFAPHSKHAAGIAAADVDNVAVEDVAAEVSGGQVE